MVFALLVNAGLIGVSLSAGQGLAIGRADGPQDWAQVTCHPGSLVNDTVAGIYPSTSGTPATCTNFAIEGEDSFSVDFVQYASRRAAQRDISMFPMSKYPVLACSAKQVQGGYTVLAVASSMFTPQDTNSYVRAHAPRVLAELSQFEFAPC